MSYDPNDPFYIPNMDLKEAIEVLNSVHEVQIEYKRLINIFVPEDDERFKHLRMAAIMMGYPTMLDAITPD
jgi:hypothetical protein